ncbi:hypothetical protein Golomagni_04534 [Golovinomyces magnicellulatus]|nr:hypothetical protein Golomagni_04534 [Golovinomyces magnicellulatus]
MSRVFKAQTSASSVPDGGDLNDSARWHQMRPPRWSMGIMNVPTTHHVPGSIVLLSESSKRPGEKNSATTPSIAEQGIVRNEKKKTSDCRIILEPQPEDSCNDPLNWPLWRKDLVLFSVGFFAMVGGGMTPLLAAGFSNVATNFHISVAQVSLTTGLYMLGLGLGSVITSPTAILFGKRPLYIIGAILFVFSSIWCALASSFTSLILGRILQGISVSPVECLPSATITEVYFLHERAYRIGIYSFLLLGGKNLVPLVSAAIIESYGWRWVFWIVAIVGFLCGIFLFFLAPESFWERALHSPLVSESNTNNLIRSESRKNDFESRRAASRTDKSIDMNNLDPAHSGNGIYPSGIPKTEVDLGSNYTAQRRNQPQMGYVSQLRLWNGRLANDSWLQVAFRPFVHFAYPAVVWSALVYACSIGWLIAISESVTLLFRTRATYNFSALTAGLIYLSPFIGGVIGTAIAGRASDFIVQDMAKRNKNIYEPEFRLVMAIPITITTVMGLVGLGWSVEVVDHWIVPTLFFGIVSFGCSLGAATSMTFCVDSYQEYAGEALVTLNFCKNILHGLVFSFFINQWIERNGPKIVFIWLGVIQLVIMLTTIPMYIFGKRARMWTVRMAFMERFDAKRST